MYLWRKMSRPFFQSIPPLLTRSYHHVFWVSWVPVPSYPCLTLPYLLRKSTLDYPREELYHDGQFYVSTWQGHGTQLFSQTLRVARCCCEGILKLWLNYNQLTYGDYSWLCGWASFNWLKGLKNKTGVSLKKSLLSEDSSISSCPSFQTAGQPSQ